MRLSEIVLNRGRIGLYETMGPTGGVGHYQSFRKKRTLSSRAPETPSYPDE